MKERLISLLMELPFERVMELLAQEDIQIKYDAHYGGYNAHYWKDGVQISVRPVKNIKLAAAEGIISHLTHQKEEKI